jgi:hypothetical protein
MGAFYAQATRTLRLQSTVWMQGNQQTRFQVPLFHPTNS